MLDYTLLRNDSPETTIYWGIGEHEENPEAIVGMIETLTDNAPFRLVAFKTDHWNDDFSPWKAPAVFGKEDFAGKGQDTLEWLTNQCIARVEKEGKARQRFIAGYSLSGLFALWAAMKTSLFDGVASCSGSLWFPCWKDYLTDSQLSSTTNVYLSLGDLEEKTRNTAMAKVGDNTRTTYDRLKTQRHTTLVWNKGGHFNEPTLRTAKGIAWLLNC